MSHEKQEAAWLDEAIDLLGQSPGLQFLVRLLIVESGFMDGLPEDPIALQRRAGSRQVVLWLKALLDERDPRIFPSLLVDQAAYILQLDIKESPSGT